MDAMTTASPPHGFDEQLAQEWDWLPGAAIELEEYLRRLMAEEPINAHLITARSKSIGSFLRKCRSKGYDDPRTEVTDLVAARVIVYTSAERERAMAAIRDRFSLTEDRNPGDERDPDKKGYDCWHFIATGERFDSQWIRRGGDLDHYFHAFNGLEIQVRTVAAHAWAEYEHELRYKSKQYEELSPQGRAEIDALFLEAHTLRQRLDDSFLNIADRLRDLPGQAAASTAVEDSPAGDATLPAAALVQTPVPVMTPDEIDIAAVRAWIAARYPDAEEPSEQGLRFAVELLRSIGDPLDQIKRRLDRLPAGLVARNLRRESTTVTRVRALDDELLASYGERYLHATQHTGSDPSMEARLDQLRWRWRLIRNKVPRSRD